MNRKFLLIFFIACILIVFVSFFGPALPASSSLIIPDSRSSVELPILMYHSITENKTEVNEYTILNSTFESDLKWLGDNGFTSVSASQLVDYVEKGTPLPSKPVMITFDDGYANNYDLAYPLLQKYHMKAIISVIGSQSDASSGDIYRNLFNSNLSWGEISIMSGSGSIEIGNHTYDLHSDKKGRKGADMKKGESFDSYSRILREDLLKNQEKIALATGSEPLVFAWPYGAYPLDGSANQILKDAGFKLSLTSYQKMNVIERGNPKTLFGLKRFLRTPDFDMNKII